MIFVESARFRRLSGGEDARFTPGKDGTVGHVRKAGDRQRSRPHRLFTNIALDEKVPCKMRMTAAIEANTLALFSKNRVQFTLRMSMAYEDALEQYRKSFPRDVEDDE